MKCYDPGKIEQKWQKRWEEEQTFKIDIVKDKPKYYVLDMFPFISGFGLHIGHVVNYTATDIVARYKRQRGFNVLHPMGWDSFGLPAEQHAIRTGTHPRITTEKGIEVFRKQLKSLGFSYDWSREFGTHEPSYYKWTQWIFTKLYERGLAYEASMPVNYCPALGTVLANEEVVEGKSVEGGHAVERRFLRQWVLKITEYADRLLKDLDLVDWPESLKRLQRNWIGKSEAAEVYFSVKGEEEKIRVFTTRPDTLFGATYMVLSPEHPLIDRLVREEYRDEVAKYRKEAALKSDLERTDLAREKSGVFTGAFAINPVNGRDLPIWISDYVLMGYGTGAIMAVPSHDERDFEFALTYKLPVIAVFDPNMEAHPELVPAGKSLKEIREEVIRGVRCWQGEGKCINSENSEITLNGLTVKKAIARIVSWLEEKGFGRQTVNYRLRDWLFSRQRYWGEPFPILHFEDGTKRALDIDELPLSPPELTDFRPPGDGRSPLAKASDWVNIIDSKTGKPAKRETNTMPQWAGSCWYYLRFCDPHNDKEAWSKESEKYWLPVDMYVGGVEHAVLHLLYARFWHKVLYDCGLVSTPEPFYTLRNQGLVVTRSFKNGENQYVPVNLVVEKNGNYYHSVTGEELLSQIEKMSKSKLNGVSPDEITGEFGVDALRLYVMFMGPLDKEKVWNRDGVGGCKRFLRRVYEMLNSSKVSDDESREASLLVFRLVKGVERDIEKMQFNTAIAKMMEFINAFTRLDSYPRKSLRLFLQCLHPFAPHLASEGWETLGFKGKIDYFPWPEVEDKYLREENITYVIQINGRVRARMIMPKDMDKESLFAKAGEDKTIAKYLVAKEIKKLIFVPNRLLNIVVN